MNLFDLGYLKSFLKTPRQAIKEAKAVRVRIILASKTNTSLFTGIFSVIFSQLLLPYALPIAILLSLFGAYLIIVAGWLQFTFNKRCEEGDTE